MKSLPTAVKVAPLGVVTVHSLSKVSAVPTSVKEPRSVTRSSSWTIWNEPASTIGATSLMVRVALAWIDPRSSSVTVTVMVCVSEGVAVGSSSANRRSKV